MFCMVLILLGFLNFTQIQCKNELSAIVMPFHRKQLKKLMFNMKTWQFFTPSASKSIRPELILFSSGPYSEKLNSDINEFISGKDYLIESFSFISLQFANLTVMKDSYFRGTRLMFEMVLSGNRIRYKRPVSHIFYMEPDCVPIRKYWLDAINSQIEDGKQFWMKGSRYKGGYQFVTSESDAFHIHLNGNAIYNIGSKEFRDFYNRHVKSAFESNEAYDLKIFEVLLSNEGTLMKTYGDKFIPIKTIQNTCGKMLIWSKYLEQNTETFLIHLTNHWQEYLTFYNTQVPQNEQVNLNQLS